MSESFKVRTENGEELILESGAIITVNGVSFTAAQVQAILSATSTLTLSDITDVTATAAQVNRTAVSTPGVAQASKTAVLGANLNLDVLAVADLKLGAGAGTSVTASAAELNRTAVTTPGVAEASKVAVLGANLNLDVLAVADLKLGAGAGTSVTATAAELNLADGARGVGLLGGTAAGKVVIGGIVAVADTGAVALDLSATLADIDSIVLTFQDAPAATACYLSCSVAGTTVNISSYESDFTAGTTAANVKYLAIGTGVAPA